MCICKNTYSLFFSFMREEPFLMSSSATFFLLGKGEHTAQCYNKNTTALLQQLSIKQANKQTRNVIGYIEQYLRTYVIEAYLWRIIDWGDIQACHNITGLVPFFGS